MFLYKLYRFGYTTQKAVGGSKGEYSSAAISWYSILTVTALKMTSFLEYPLSL